jgi:hypothetical protein
MPNNCFLQKNNYWVSQEAAMGSNIGDAPFNSISLISFYYALDYALCQLQIIQIPKKVVRVSLSNPMQLMKTPLTSSG